MIVRDMGFIFIYIIKFQNMKMVANLVITVQIVSTGLVRSPEIFRL